jgi:hypothetical protein
MPYGIIKIDTITFTDGGVDKSVSISGLVQNPTFSGNITVTGTVSGNTIQGQTVSGVTVTGTTSNFASGVFTTQISGATVTGNVGSFTTITGGTVTLTSGVFDAGTASAPSIAFTGDLNTGIYSPGADQVAVATGGTRRLVILSDGKVGLGAASVLQQGSGVDGGSAAGVLELYNGGTGNTTLENTGAFPILFKTNGNERLRITSAGLVGVGTSAPNCRFEVSGGSAITTLANSYSNCGILHNYSASTLLAIGNDGTSPVLQGVNATNNTARNILLNPLGGSVGIGTTSPAVLLQLGNTGSTGLGFDASNAAIHGTFGSGGSIVIRAQISSSSGGGQIFLGGSTRGDANVNSIVFSTANTDRAKIDANGYLTIASNRINGFELDGSSGTIFNSFGSGGNLTLRAQSGSIAGGGEIFLGGSTRGDANVNAIVFSSANTERARIDSSGRLLVGTSSSPSAGLGQYALAVVQGYAGGTTGEGILSIARGKVATSMVNTDTVGQIAFTDNAGNTFAKIFSFVDGTVSSTSDLPGGLTFSTTADGASSPTERMRIRNNGRTDFIGTATDYTLVTATSQSAGTTTEILTGVYGSTGVGSGTVSFRVYSNGNVQNTNNSYGAISDIKLKENIADANSQWSDIKALQVRKYNFKEGQTHTQIGLVAQEVELVSPGLVTESPNRDAEGNDLGTVTKSVNYSVLYMKAVKALQEAMERIETLEASNADLLARVSALEDS